MSHRGLIVVDVQNDFCSGGALAVPDGDAVVSVVNDLMADFDDVILTQDWHPLGHSSFASHHKNAAPFTAIEMPYGEQTLWPDHCVQGSFGAEFHSGLHTDKANAIIRKGHNPLIDSYSAFFENDRTTTTGLGGLLRARGIEAITLAGLATDFCVFYSAMDAVRLGFSCSVFLGGCRGIDLDGSLDAALSAMESAGVHLRGL